MLQALSCSNIHRRHYRMLSGVMLTAHQFPAESHDAKRRNLDFTVNQTGETRIYQDLSLKADKIWS